MRSACHFVCLNTSLVIKDTQLLFFLTFGLLWALICFSPSCGLFLSFALTLFLSYSLAFYIENIHISSSIFPLGNMGWETIYHFYFIQMTNLDISTKNSYSILYVLWHGESLNWRQESLLFPSLLKEGTRICVMELSSWWFLHLLGSLTGKLIFLPFEKKSIDVYNFRQVSMNATFTFRSFLGYEIVGPYKILHILFCKSTWAVTQNGISDMYVFASANLFAKIICPMSFCKMVSLSPRLSSNALAPLEV